MRDEKAEKELFFQKKKKEEIDRLEAELTQERGKGKKLEIDFAKQVEDMKEKNRMDLESIEESQKLTLDLLS